MDAEQNRRSMSTPLLRSEIAEAEQQLGIAEQQLAGAVGELRTVPRAEKTVTTSLVEGALDRVTAARTKLRELLLLSSQSD